LASSRLSATPPFGPGIGERRLKLTIPPGILAIADEVMHKSLSSYGESR
jgi:hypothetical protein